MSELRVALRTAIRSRLVDGLADPYEPYNVVTVSYRPTRRPITLPAVTFRDRGVRVASIIPLFDRTLYIDIWTESDLDQAEAIAHKINALLDNQPLPLPGGEGKVMYLSLREDEDVPSNDADLVRKMLTYKILVYEYNGPAPFAEGS